MKCKQSFDVVPHMHVSTPLFATAKEEKNDTGNMFCITERKLEAHLSSITMSCSPTHLWKSHY